MTSIDWQVLEAALARPDRLLCEWCARGQHGIHHHPAFAQHRHRMDGCRCWCLWKDQRP